MLILNAGGLQIRPSGKMLSMHQEGQPIQASSP